MKRVAFRRVVAGSTAADAGHHRACAIMQRARADGDDVPDGLTGERLAALGDEEPRQMIAARGRPAFDATQFIAGYRMFDGQSVLEARDPDAGLFQVHIFAAQRDCLADAQTVAVHHLDEQVVAAALTGFAGRFEQ